MKKFKIAGWIVAVMILSNCQEETIIDSKGDIVGFVKLFDEKGVEIQDKSNVKITLDEKHTVVTDAIGRFNFKGIEPGTYQVVYEKEGFGTVKKFNYIFTAGNVQGVLSETNLISLSNISLISKNLEITASSIRITGTMTETESYYFIYYFVDKADAEPSDFLGQYGYSFCCGQITTFDHYVPVPTSLPSPLFIVCYAASTASQQGQYNYYDYEKGKSVNPAIKKLFDPVRIK
jgi:hypothetical protein